VRLYRSSLRVRISDARVVAFATVALGLTSACGGGTAAAPTPTVVASASVAPAVAPSPQRPPLASPVASPSVAAVTAASTPTSTAEGAGGDTYEVASGDTLLTIATDHYGDSAQWRRIYDANKDVIGADPDKLKIGMKLKIPPKQ
jgi:nucleoid-associated protein YgaU